MKRGRTAADAAGSQHLVANGLAFTADGRTVYAGDTARGALWRVQLDRHGIMLSKLFAGRSRAAAASA